MREEGDIIISAMRCCLLEGDDVGGVQVVLKVLQIAFDKVIPIETETKLINMGHSHNLKCVPKSNQLTVRFLDRGKPFNCPLFVLLIIHPSTLWSLGDSLNPI